MNTVRITGWHSGSAPTALPQALRKLLQDAGVEESDLEDVQRRLLKGTFVDIYFDLGEDEAARAFMRQVGAYGLRSQLHDEKPTWFPKSRPWLLWCLCGCLAEISVVSWLYTKGKVGLGVLAWSSAFAVVLVRFVAPWVAARRPKSELQRESQREADFRNGMGLSAVMALAGITWAEPRIGVVLLVLAAGGIVCAAIIRHVNQN